MGRHLTKPGELKVRTTISLPIKEYQWVVNSGLQMSAIALRKIHELMLEEKNKDLTPEEEVREYIHRHFGEQKPIESTQPVEAPVNADPTHVH